MANRLAQLETNRLASLNENRLASLEGTEWLSGETSIARPFAELGKGLFRGTEQTIGTFGSLARWGAETKREVEAATGLFRPGGHIDIAEYLFKKFGPEKVREMDKEQLDMYARMGEKWADFWYEQAGKGWEAPSPDVMQAKWKEMPFTKAAATIGEAAPSYLTALGVSVITKNPQLGLTILSTQAGGAQYRRQRKAGTGIKMASAVSMGTAAWEYVTEKIPFEYALKGVKRPLLKFVTLPAIESAQEVIQGMGENILEHFGYNAKDWASVPVAVKEGISHTMDGFMENLVGGLGLGLFGGGGGVIAQKAGWITAPAEAPLAEQPFPLEEVTPEATAPVTERPFLNAAVKKLTNWIETSKAPRAIVEREKHRKLQQRVARGAQILEAGEGKEAFLEATRPLKGRLLEDVAFEPTVEFQQEDITNLYEQVRVTDKRFFTKLNTAKALTKLLNRQIPTAGERQLLEEQFGSELVGAIMKRRPPWEKVKQMSLEIANLPRAMLASFDLSASFRQGFFLGIAHPVKWAGAFGEQVKAFLSEDAAIAAEQIIYENPNYDLMRDSGLYIAPRTQAAPDVSQREEEFMSRFAQSIPYVKWSERAYITFLNKLRVDVFNHIIGQPGWEDARMGDYKALAQFINHATGRGTIKKHSDLAALMNVAFFSPRFALSRFQMPVDLFSRSKLARNEAAKTLVKAFGTGAIVLSLVGLSGLGDVELDPRSSDFGKIRIGSMRIDFWAGYAQVMRMIAQLISGTRKTTTTREFMKQDRLDTIFRFLRFKLAPVPAAIVDLLQGKTAVGEELTTETAPYQAMRRLAPIFLQDVYEVIKYEGLSGATGIAMPLSFFGVGVQAWKTRPTGQKRATFQKRELKKKPLFKRVR